MAQADFSEIAKLSERFNKDPKSRMFVQLADAYRKNNMIDEALEVLNKGLQYHSQYPLAYLIQGKCFIDKRMLNQARESFEKTISLDPQNVLALQMLAQTCESLKDEAGMISAYQAIITIDPLDEATKAKLMRLEGTQKRAPLYTISVAQEYEKQGNMAEAMTAYQNLLATDPTDLVLQNKIKELKSKIAKEERKIEEEKIAGLHIEPHFKPEDLLEKEKTVPSEPRFFDIIPDVEPVKSQPPPAVEIVQTPMAEPTMPPIKESEPAEKVFSLDDFLTPESAEETEPIIQEPIAHARAEIEIGPTAQDQEPTTIEDLLTEPEKTKIEEVTQPPQPETQPAVEIKEPRPAEKIEEPRITERIEAQKPETTELEKKPKEEDFKSFQEWLSGLLK